MNRFFYVIIATFFIISCEVIEGPYINGDITPIDTSNNNYVKKVLIEDFTGHTCNNCPDAARELDLILAAYTNTIGLAIHSVNSFTRPYPIDITANPDEKFTYDFRTSWGGELDNFFEIASGGLPKGMINRIDYSSNGNHRKDWGEWQSIVGDELNNDVLFGINIEVNQTPLMLSDQFDVVVNSKALIAMNGNYKLVVCLAENNITNWQKDGNIDDPSYAHKHVLRSFLTPTFGEDLAAEEINNSYDFSNAYSFIISDLENQNIIFSNTQFPYTLPNYTSPLNIGEWDNENISIIAYIYDESSNEILQVEEKSLLNK
tara:strand:- start:156 stop:1106 length:951 start_codon:yes stop_codon:yes gene_type:complete